jgi:hypothetical protein
MQINVHEGNDGAPEPFGQLVRWVLGDAGAEHGEGKGLDEEFAEPAERRPRGGKPPVLGGGETEDDEHVGQDVEQDAYGGPGDGSSRIGYDDTITH